ncbi:MAG: transposase [Pseudonocardia sp.]
MAGQRRTFDRQFKADAVRLVLESGRTQSEVAAELGVDRRTLSNWVRATRAGQKASAPPTAPPTSPGAGPTPVTPRRSRGRTLEERLTATHWEDRALAILQAEGIESVKIPRLCADLGVTRGSFYWHFADLPELLRAVADRWAEKTRHRLATLVDMQKLPPRERLAQMTGMLISGEFIGTERSIRQWARTDPLIAKIVTETDLHVHALLHGALLELGFEPREARVRSAILSNAGIGFAQGNSPLPAPTTADIEMFYAIVVGIDITIPPA